MEKLFKLLAPALLLLALTSCDDGTPRPGNQSPFKGFYSPQTPIAAMRYDVSEEGVEIQDRSVTYQNVWLWNTQRQLSSIVYDIDGVFYTNGPIRDDYQYDSQGRLEQINHYVGGSLQRAFNLNYSNGLLDRVTFPWGQNGLMKETRFKYRSGDQYPKAVVLVRPLEDWLRDIYHTDTLIQTWTLEWNNGNLVRATADSIAKYCTGKLYIDYVYDNRPNPLQGFLNADYITNNSFVDNPYFMSRNNMVQRIDHYSSQTNDSTVTYMTDFHFEYLNNGLPANVTYTIPTMIWTEVTTTAHFVYGEHISNE